MAIQALTVGYVLADLAGRRLKRPGGREVELTHLEASLLGYLAEHRGRTIQRQTLLVEVWGYAPGVASRAVDHTISRLRRKLDTASEWLVSVRGGGYRLEVEPRELPPLPEAHTPFVGRAADLKRLIAIVDAEDRVSLVGIGGIGKSRLALAVAQHWEGLGRGEAVWVPLGGATERRDVLVALGHALGTRADQVLAWLHGRDQLLIVLDEVERLDDTSLDFLSDLHGPRILLTSQRSVPGAVDVPLGPMASDDATALLVACCRRPVDQAMARRVAAAVDDVPFAVEIVARWLTVGGADDAIARIDHLRGRGPDRHASIHATLAWGWSDLSPRAQSALQAAATFVAPFRIPDLEAVAATTDLADACADLADRGWLAPRGEGLAMFQVVRNFLGSVGHAPGPDHETRHTAWILAWSSTLRERHDQSRQPALLAEIRRAEPEIRAALRRDPAPEIAGELIRSMYLELGVTPCGPAIDDLEGVIGRLDPSSPLLPHLWSRLGMFRQQTGDLPESMAALVHARSLTRDPDHGYRLDAALASTRLRLGEYVTDALTAAVDHLSAGNRPHTASIYRTNLAVCHIESGDWQTARTLLLAVIDDQEHLSPTSMVICLVNLIEVEEHLGDRAAAGRWFALSEKIARAGGVVWALDSTYHNQGCYAADRGDLQGARAYFREAQRLGRSRGSRRIVDMGDLQIAGIALEEGDAAQSLELALAVVGRDNPNRRVQATAWARVGEAHLWMGSADLALPWLQRATDAWTEIGAEPTNFAAELALAHLALGQADAATTILATLPEEQTAIVGGALDRSPVDPEPIDDAELRLAALLARRVVSGA